MLRSVPMSYCQMYFQHDTVFEKINQLGEMECVQFVDLNAKIQPQLKHFIIEVARCTELERKLRRMQAEMVRDNICIVAPATDPPPIDVTEINEFENVISNWEKDVTTMATHVAYLTENDAKLREMCFVLKEIGPMVKDGKLWMEQVMKNRKKGDVDVESYGRLYLFTGLVKRERSFSFQMMLWRVSLGNIYYRQSEADSYTDDPVTKTPVRKVGFITVCQGETLKARMEKVFDGFKVSRYPCPEEDDVRMDMITDIGVRLGDLQEIKEKAKLHRCLTLRSVSKLWMEWNIRTRKTKAIYHTMNLLTMDVTRKCLIGQCWVPQFEVARVQDAMEPYVTYTLDMKLQTIIVPIETELTPPTYHRTTKFTYGFQMLIDAYALSKFGELNPAVYAMISFPFIFAVMFGDVGHGIIFIAIGAYLIIMENHYTMKRGREIWNIIFGGRYVILLLGLWSVYTGFVYNEIFGRSINLTTSMWKNTVTLADMEVLKVHQLDGKSRLNKPYVFGIDPIWQLAENKALVVNSIKLKMALIIGTLHMMFGLLLNIPNHVHFRNYHLIILQFLPEFAFLCSIFLWLVFLICYKWWYFYDQNPDSRFNAVCAPSLLLTFLSRFMPVTVDNEEPCSIYMFQSQLTIQKVLDVIAICCIPVLLIGKAVLLYFINTAKKESILKEISTFRKYQIDVGDNKDVHEKILLVEMSEIITSFPDLILQESIHAAEFVLSTISHTTSYLRLWALSMAHSQLSKMLWDAILSKNGLQHYSSTPVIAVVKLFLAFAVWSVFNIGLIIVMEGLASFLHALRLHWIEFMSKFHVDNGIPFQPFSFEALLAYDTDTVERVTKSKKRKFY